MGEREQRERESILSDTQGLTTVEYIVLICLIGIVSFSGWRTFGETIRDKIGIQESTLAGLGPSDILSGSADHLISGSVTTRSGSTATTSDGVGDSGATTSGVATDGDSMGDGAEASGGTWGEGGFLGRGDGTGLGAVARGVADGAADVIGGTIEGIGAMADGLWHAATHPGEVADAIADAVTHPGETADAAWAAATETADRVYTAGRDLVEACASGDGYACSRGVTNVAAAVIPVGTAGTVARSAGAVRTGTSGAKRIGAAVRRRRDGDDPAVEASGADGGAPLARDAETGRWEPDPRSPAAHERYKREVRAAQRRQDLLDSVEDEDLRNIIGGRNGQYRENASIGSGSTADAVRHERRTGERVGGATHTQKAEEGRGRLAEWLEKNPNASAVDREIAEQLHDDLTDALYGPLD
jgi:hypothetical protein